MKLLQSFGRFFAMLLDDEEHLERRKRKACCRNTIKQKGDFEPDENDDFEDEMFFENEEFYE